MSLDRVTTTAFLLTYGLGLIHVTANGNYTTIPGILTTLAQIILISLTYGGVTWFLIWLDHTYYPHHQDDDGEDPA